MRFDNYLRYMHAQIEELVTNYGQIDLLWFDFSYDELCGEAWRATDLVRMVREHQPQVLIDNRLEVSGRALATLLPSIPTNTAGTLSTPSRSSRPTAWWRTTRGPGALGGLHHHEQQLVLPRHRPVYKPAPMLVRKLVECVSKGQHAAECGAHRQGRSRESIRILREIGEWMHFNHDSIYGCGIAGIEKPDFGRVTRKGTSFTSMSLTTPSATCR